MDRLSHLQAVFMRFWLLPLPDLRSVLYCRLGAVHVNVEPSEWGYTAFHPSGVAVAHSHDRTLLEEYLAQLENAGENLARTADIDLNTATEAVLAAYGPLTDVTYTTRARSTGATVSAGRTETGWGAMCINHGESTSAKNRTEAETVVSRPQEWCPECSSIAVGDLPRIPR